MTALFFITLALPVAFLAAVPVTHAELAGVAFGLFVVVELVCRV